MFCVFAAHINRRHQKSGQFGVERSSEIEQKWWLAMDNTFNKT